MKKRIISLLLCLLLLSALPLCAFAASPYVVDNAYLLDETEEAIITSQCQSIRNKYGMDLVFLTVDSLGGTPAWSYADDYYDSHGYSPNGILVLIAMAEREWYISTSGTAIRALSDRDLDALGEYMALFLSDGNYYGAFYAFAEEAPRYFGEEGGASLSINWFLSLAAGAAIAGIILLIMRSSMNTRKAQYGAGDYRVSGSFRLLSRSDLFLYSNISKIRRPQQNTNGSSGGHSSIHHSSSGRSHGGRGGKF